MTWARKGIPCICVDQEWVDPDDVEVIGPELGDYCIVTAVQALDDGFYVRVFGYATYFHLSGFRPLSNAEIDHLVFEEIKDEVIGRVAQRKIQSSVSLF